MCTPRHEVIYPNRTDHQDLTIRDRTLVLHAVPPVLCRFAERDLGCQWRVRDHRAGRRSAQIKALTMRFS